MNKKNSKSLYSTPRSVDRLHQELSLAKGKVKIGGVYAHYKHPENTYLVIGLGFREATDDICVIYQAQYDPDLVFIRELKSWLETPEFNGHQVPRFSLIN